MCTNEARCVQRTHQSTDECNWNLASQFSGFLLMTPPDLKHFTRRRRSTMCFNVGPLRFLSYYFVIQHLQSSLEEAGLEVRSSSSPSNPRGTTSNHTGSFKCVAKSFTTPRRWVNPPSGEMNKEYGLSAHGFLGPLSKPKIPAPLLGAALND